MTTLAAGTAPVEWPTEDLYYSPRGLYEFQADQIAQAYLETDGCGGKLIVWDTGLGKSHFGLRMSTLLAEDAQAGVREHDLTIVLSEKGKVGEWAEDFADFTRQSARVHLGANRTKQMEKSGLPDVLITTYETAKIDLVKFVRQPGKGKRGTSIQPGPLFEQIKDLNVLWIGDEFGAKLGNRTSDLYKAFDWTWRQMRKAHPRSHRVFGLTATPIERDWENTFNQIRLIRPDLMLTVGEWESYFVKGRHPTYGTARYHKDRMPEFVAMCQPVISRKRKSDPDVVAQFPAMVEEARHLEMGPDQQALYDAVEALRNPDDPVDGLWGTLRQIAGHPASLVEAAANGESALVKVLVEEWGAERLRSMSSCKEAWLIEHLTTVVKGQGAKVVVFTFFGQSILPVLARNLRAKKFKVHVIHGGLSAPEMDLARRAFRSDPEPCVLLTSDAGARGVNLPEATYLVEYESAQTFADRTQRINRVSRIGSGSENVTCTTAVVNYTVEVDIVTKMMERNDQHDLLLGDHEAAGNHVTADDRRRALQVSRLRRHRPRRSAR